MRIHPIPHLVLATLLAACNSDAPPGSSEATSPDTVTAARTAAGSDTAASRPQPGSLLLTPDGWGPLRIGMTLDDVVAAAGEDANPDAVGGPEPERCDEFRPRDVPAGVLVMIENGVLTRISVSRNTDITTPTGLRVGDPAADIIAAYGDRADVTPHKYVAAPAKYITVWNEPGEDALRRGIRYEVGADGVVTFLRGGGPSIEYVEGCL